MYWSRWDCPKRRDGFKIQPAFIWLCKGEKDFQREKILNTACHISLLAAIQVIQANWGKVLILLKDCCPLQKKNCFFPWITHGYMQSSALAWPRCTGLRMNFRAKSLAKGTHLPKHFQVSSTVMLMISFFLPFFQLLCLYEPTRLLYTLDKGLNLNKTYLCDR